MRKALNTFLLFVFVTVFALFVYRSSFQPEIVRTSANSTAVEKDVDKDNNIVSKDEIEKIVKEYLVNNPNLLYEILDEIQERKIDESNQKSSEFLKDNVTEINSSGEPPFIGNSESDITVVLFFDYNCSYCKQAHKHMQEVISSDDNVKFVLRPIPILGGTSLYAAKVALALHKISPDNFEKLHDEMMEMKPVSEEAVKQMVAKYEIDYKIVENEINSFSIKNLINNNFDLAKNLGLKGAPSQVINGTFVPGMIEAEKYRYIFQAVRQSEEIGARSNASEVKEKTNSSGDYFRNTNLE